MAGRVDHAALAAMAAGEAQVDLEPRAIEQPLERLVILLAGQPAEGRVVALAHSKQDHLAGGVAAQLRAGEECGGHRIAVMHGAAPLRLGKGDRGPFLAGVDCIVDGARGGAQLLVVLGLVHGCFSFLFESDKQDICSAFVLQSAVADFWAIGPCNVGSSLRFSSRHRHMPHWQTPRRDHWALRRRPVRRSPVKLTKWTVDPHLLRETCQFKPRLSANHPLPTRSLAG
jgi:hypothetical protein